MSPSLCPHRHRLHCHPVACCKPVLLAGPEQEPCLQASSSSRRLTWWTQTIQHRLSNLIWLTGPTAHPSTLVSSDRAVAQSPTERCTCFPLVEPCLQPVPAESKCSCRTPTQLSRPCIAANDWSCCAPRCRPQPSAPLAVVPTGAAGLCAGVSPEHGGLPGCVQSPATAP